MVDEKWFELLMTTVTTYLAKDEEEPLWMVRHKSQISKIMFPCAFAKALYDWAHKTWFNKKIDIWSTAQIELAKKTLLTEWLVLLSEIPSQ